MALHKYDYLFAIGTIFAFLDAWNIGANDVANSWASSVSSRSLTYIQAMSGAAVLEFVGAVGVGGRVADTIRTKVVDIGAFEQSPALLMLGMVCAVIASSLYLTMATRIGMPVSTTHSILGGVLGMGFGALGPSGIVWVGYKDDGSVNIKAGVIQVFLAWIIAPVLAGTAGAIIFSITKYGIMLRSNPTMKGLITIPLYFWLAGSLITMLLLWKGGDYEVQLTGAQIPGVIVAAGAAFGMTVGFFLIPYFYRVVIKEDWQIKWYEFVKGPMLLFRGEVPPAPADYRGVVRDFYEGHLDREELEAERARQAATVNTEVDVEAQHEKKTVVDSADRAASDTSVSNDAPAHARAPATQANEDVPEMNMYGSHIRKNGIIGPRPAGSILSPGVLFWWLKWAVFRGVDIDIHEQQAKRGVLTGDLAEIHARGDHFDNKTEYLYTFLQILTAASASFVHGANDVANAIGPYATIFQVWNTGEITGAKSAVPVWILAFGGIGIAIGAWTYGYRIMSNLGNKITLMSPSRGFSMELGSVIAVVVATRLELPVSTTQCITGAIVGVGLCNGDWRAINWRMVAWIYTGWIITVPVAATISGCLMGAITYAPNWS